MISRITAAAAIVLLTSLTIAQAGTTPATKPSIKTDHAIYEPGPAPKLPPAGGTFADPIFGTTILRVTDETHGKQNNVAYSYWPSLNKDSTRLHIMVGDEPTLFDFDPEKLTIRRKGPLFAKKTSTGIIPRWEDSIWSAKDPYIIFAHDMQRLWAYDVEKQEYTLLKDFGGHIAQMSRSADDNVFAFHRQTKAGLAYIAWQRNPDKILLEKQLPSVDEVQIDKSGRYLLIKTSEQGKGVIQAQVADLTTGQITDLLDDGPDFAPGHSDSGADMVIGADNWRNQVTGRRLSTPKQHITVLELKNDWAQDFHASMLANDDRWAVLSFYANKPLPPGPYHGEILQVATDGSQRIRRLAHHRSVTEGQYWRIPMGSISPDGRFITFTSNYNGSGQTDVFILVVPPFTEEEKYPVEKHPLMKAAPDKR